MSRNSSGTVDAEWSKNALCIATAFELSITTRAISAADFFDSLRVWIISVFATRCCNVFNFPDFFGSDYWRDRHRRPSDCLSVGSRGRASPTRLLQLFDHRRPND